MAQQQKSVCDIGLEAYRAAIMEMRGFYDQGEIEEAAVCRAIAVAMTENHKIETQLFALLKQTIDHNQKGMDDITAGLDAMQQKTIGSA